jgi:hypothetical protein
MIFKWLSLSKVEPSLLCFCFVLHMYTAMSQISDGVWCIASSLDTRPSLQQQQETPKNKFDADMAAV